MAQMTPARSSVSSHSHEGNSDVKRLREALEEMTSKESRQCISKESRQCIAKWISEKKRCKTLLGMAERDGCIVELLANFRVPLNSYPEYAQRAGSQAIEFLSARCRALPGSSSKKHPVETCWASPEAQLLSNYLLADCPASSSVLQAISEYMVVFTDFHSAEHEESAADGAWESGEAKSSSSTTRAYALPFSGSFPLNLDIMYIQREFTVPRDERVQRGDPGDGANRKVWFCLATLRFFFNGCLVDTSHPVSTENFNEHFRRRILLPANTTHLVYLYNNNDGFNIGGFLCYEKSDSEGGLPLAVNTINFEHGSTACTFGRRQQFPPDRTRHASWKDVSVEQLKKRGAVKYCFVRPEDYQGDKDNFLQWGFMYQMQNDAVLFFPISSAGYVVDRAQLDGELSCAILPHEPDEDGRPEFFLVKVPWDQFTSPAGCWGVNSDEVPVWIARLALADELHPEVLNSIALTKSKRVYECCATHAIATAAFVQVRGAVIADLSLEVASLCSVFAVGRHAKFGHFRLGQADLGIPQSVLSLILLVVLMLWIYALRAEVCRFFGFRRHRWYREYLQSSSTWCSWVHLALLLYLIVWMDLGLLRGFHKMHDIRLLLAMLGSMHWWRVIWLCTGFRRLGKLILPITAALGQVWEFAVVMTVLMAWYVQVSYTLSSHGRTLGYVWFAAYRLGILGDFDTDSDVLFEPAEAENEAAASAAAAAQQREGGSSTDWVALQYVVFIGASFLLAVAMTNIFIGIMSNAFDYNTERVEELFTRRRATVALNYILRRDSLWMLCPACQRRQGINEHANRLWYCHAFEVAQQGCGRTSQQTMRSVIQKATKDLHARVTRIDADLRGLVAALARGQAVASRSTGGAASRKCR